MLAPIHHLRTSFVQVYLKLKQRRDDEFDLDEDEMIEGFVTTADLCLPWIVPYRKKMDLTEDCGAPYGDIKEVRWSVGPSARLFVDVLCHKQSCARAHTCVFIYHLKF